MTTAASQFTGNIPEQYDAGLGPVLFEPSARDLARRAAALGSPANVLELAAGTGISTRRLRDALPGSAPITATDLNDAMLAVARPRFRDNEKVSFRTADALSLPFGDGEFDLIVCQYGVMFFPDKVVAFREARRVLKTGGHYLFNVWGPIGANPFAAITVEVGEKMFPENPPRFYRVPFGYSDTAAVTADAKAGGFAHVAHERVAMTTNVADWALFANGLVRGNPMIAEIEAQDPAGPDKFKAGLIAALRARFGNEPAPMPLQAFVFVCN